MRLLQLTLEEKDFNTHNFLQWFVMEQVEEEKSAQAIIDKLKLGGKNNLYQFDRDIYESENPCWHCAGDRLMKKLTLIFSALVFVIIGL